MGGIIISSFPVTENSVSPKTAEEPTGPSKAMVETSIAGATSGGAKDAVVKLFDMIMVFAHMSRASDVHLEPWKEHCQIRLRVDGILHDEFETGQALYLQLVARLKILTEMRTDEHRSPQDGRFRFTGPLGDVDVRVSILPTSFGEKVVLRLLSSQSHKLSLDQLGFSPDDLARIEKAIRKPWGMILATGPPRSAASTRRSSSSPRARPTPRRPSSRPPRPARRRSPTSEEPPAASS